jgi:hypothetical protein
MKKIKNIDVGSELYSAGLTEDGDEYVALRYFVVAEYSDDSRMRHLHNFKGTDVIEGFDPEHGDYFKFFSDVREQAIARAEKAATHIRKAVDGGLTLNFSHWVSMHSVYGSSAYEEEVLNMTAEERSQ